MMQLENMNPTSSDALYKEYGVCIITAANEWYRQEERTITEVVKNYAAASKS